MAAAAAAENPPMRVAALPPGAAARDSPGFRLARQAARERVRPEPSGPARWRSHPDRSVLSAARTTGVRRPHHPPRSRMPARPNPPSPPRSVLLRSSWQTVNIGDIAHTPGALALMEEHLPGVEVRLWPMDAGNGVREMLRKRFPAVRIVESEAALVDAFAECDFLLHGSGPYLVGEADVKRWISETHKPWGALGITWGQRRSSQTEDIPPPVLRETAEVLSTARFAYFRDSASRRFAEEQGCDSPVMAFGPDAAFACDVRDDDSAESFLREHRLEPGRYLCCIPRLRYTPGWDFASKNKPVDPIKHRRNQEKREADHAPLLDAIRRVVEETELRVLVCPEDETQVKLGREALVDRLPAALQDRVVWRSRFWGTDEALGVYERSAGLFGHEMHSPILCIGRGLPAVVCRWAEQSSKGIMWRDIGLGDWLFDLDAPGDAERLAPAVLEMAKHPEAARSTAETARERVAGLHARMMGQLRRELSLTRSEPPSEP